MADLSDHILHTLKDVQATQHEMRGEMNTHFSKLNGRVSAVEAQVENHESTLNKVKGGVAAISSIGGLLALFHEKFDGVLKVLGLGK